MEPRGILLLSVCGIALSVRADTFVVANTSDDGPGSFRQAILNAASSPGPDAVTFSNVTGQIMLLSQLSVKEDVNITGPGAHQLTIFCAGSAVGTPTQPGIVIEPSAAATISGLRLTRGGDSGWGQVNGGLISNAGTLSLRDCELIAVQLYLARGAAIYNRGNLLIS